MARLRESCEAVCIVMSISSSYADEKLLAVRKLQHETGKTQTEETFEVLGM